MRYWALLFVLLAAQAGAAAWAIGEHNVARPGGAYSTLDAQSAEACERLCAEDSLCMAWSFQANACELKAIVPAAIAQAGAVSGVSRRAPASMRVMPPQPSAQPAAAERPAVLAQAPEPIAGAYDPSRDLLGGPDADEGLRTSLGNQGSW